MWTVAAGHSVVCMQQQADGLRGVRAKRMQNMSIRMSVKYHIQQQSVTKAEAASTALHVTQTDDHQKLASCCLTAQQGPLLA